MTKKISVPRGTTDILPEEIPIWQEIEKKSRELFKLYNFKEIRTPIYEESVLFERSLGETSDVVNKQLLRLATDKKEGFALRPEGTASVVRSYIENAMDRQKSVSKLFYIGPMFRGERPQKGRLRQFHQIGIEVIGPGAFQAFLDAEVIHLSVQLLEHFGLKDFTLRLNTLGSFEDKKEFSRYLRANLEKEKNGLCKDCQGRYDRNVFRILDCKQVQCIDIVGQLKLDNSYYSKESRDYFESVKEALDILGVKYVLAPSLVRGLDYYTHTVFEISDKSLGSQDALGAGGRYNHLLKDLGFNDSRFETEAGAMGFSLGIERIILALHKNGKSSEDRLDAYLMASDQDKMYKRSFKLLQELRSRGVCADMFYRGASRKNKERAAQKESNPRFYVFIDEENGKDKKVVIENRGTKQKTELAIDAADQIADLVKGQL